MRYMGPYRRKHKKGCALHDRDAVAISSRKYGVRDPDSGKLSDSMKWHYDFLFACVERPEGQK